MEKELFIIHFLKNHSQTIATAESCTGGLMGHRLTNVPGASQVFQQGFIVYSNEAKENLLHVPKSTLEKFGAVSREVAKIMAERVREVSKTTFGLAVTGIAGPTGGSKEKPVGTVFLALAQQDMPTKVWHEFFPEERLFFKEKVVEKLFDYLIEALSVSKG